MMPRNLTYLGMNGSLEFYLRTYKYFIHRPNTMAMLGCLPKSHYVPLPLVNNLADDEVTTILQAALELPISHPRWRCRRRVLEVL